MLKSLKFLSGLLLIASPAFADTHFYLRCHTTSWDLNDQSLLKPDPKDSLLTLRFEVKDPRLVEAGDDCVITETPGLNNYGGQSSLLRVPESSPLRRLTATDAKASFKLRFPALGHYRFLLNTHDGYFSVRKDAEPKAGEVSWTLPGLTQSDGFGHLFLFNSYPQNTLSLVEPSSGLPLWTYRSDSALSLANNCSTADLAFVTRKGRVAAIALANGREVWRTDLNGALKETEAGLNCYPKQDQLFLSYGKERSTLVALDKAGGRVLWSWKGRGNAGFLGADASRVFVSTFQNGESELQALDKNSGRELWRLQPGRGYDSLTEDGALYRVEGARISSISAQDGRILWTYQGSPEGALWPSFENGGLFVHEPSGISRLDQTSGRVSWAYDYSRLSQPHPYAQMLKAGIVLIQADDYPHHSSERVALDGGSGQLLWQEEALTNASVSEDDQNGAWVIDGKTLNAFDPRSGRTLWSFTLASEQPRASFMDVMERDAATVYVSYGIVGSKYPPMGVLALDAASGRLKWQNGLESFLYRAAGDGQQLIINDAYSGSTKVLKK